ncbi:MAG: DNA-protecting protein DprA [Ruminococcaceae bacterium]|nr:DNA-protecting protein DprA [Oscillospiraceae bacterium]
MYDDNTLYWIWLADKCGAASKEFAKLIARFENPFEIYRLEPEEIDAIDFIGERLKAALSKKSLESAYSVIKYCRQKDVSIISYGDKRYPSRLKTLEDPPAVLYCLGEIPDFDKRLCVAVVGTRDISAYGAQSAYKISYELAAANVCVVSGMALGIDAVAACGALEALGDTVAVLGCGIDMIYPKQHARLHCFIRNRGTVITEYPPATPPYGSNFPKRNRIISGLSQGVLVVEGNRSSGAMITAKCAVTQGRDLFALPGKINESNSDGPNELIKNGANVALSSDDIIVHFDFLYHDTINYRDLKIAKYSQNRLTAEILKKYGVELEIFQSQSTQNAEKTNAEARRSAFAAEPKHEEKPEEKEELPAKSEEEMAKDSSDKALELLDPLTRRVFELMPIDKAASPDEFITEGVGIAEAITSLTMLEINGLVSSLPGGKYIRK